MPTNQYINHNVVSEQRLYEDLIIESIQHYGENVFYIPREVEHLDKILNEDAWTHFNSAYMVEMYPESIDGFEGQGDLMERFGLEIRDEVTLVVAKRVWERWVGQHTNTEWYRPMEGDLIFLPWAKTFFEITFVEHEQPFYQLMHLPVYKLKCSLFELSEERISTKYKEIDELYKDRSVQTVFKIGNITGEFELEEIISQTVQKEPEVIVNAELTRWDKTEDNLYVTRVHSTGPGTVADFGVFEHGITELYGGVGPEYAISRVVGQTSGASADIIKLFDINTSEEDLVNIQDGVDTDRSWEYTLFTQDFLDFTERNPFGEVDDNIDIFNTSGNL